MAVRTGMTDLIGLVARLVNDEDSAYHSEQDIQDALDRNRWEARYLQLDNVPTRASGGTVTYVTFTAPVGWDNWESSAVLYDYNYDSLTPDTSDWNTGRWTFATEPTRPVFILGFSYDPYGAAAELLDVRASQVSEDIESFSVFNGSFGYAKKREGPLSLAKTYRGKMRTTVQTVYRTDVNLWPN